MPITAPIELEAATLTPGEKGVLEIHFKQEVKLGVKNVQEVLDTRQRICGDRRYLVLVTLPEDIDFDLNVLSLDHYQHRNMELCTYAVAWEAGSSMNEKLVDLFYRHFPQPFPVHTFRSHAEAREWPAKQGRGTAVQ
jgi:hypothetical protein